MRESLTDYCARCGSEALLQQWHGTKNEDLTPDAVSCGSHKMVWWKCAQGHEWQSPPYSRVGRSSGCPYCAGKRPSPGRDLASLYPYLSTQWHAEKNAPLTPAQVLPGSHKRVWWRCEQGHEWSASVKSRTGGSGCPICAHKETDVGCNDLQTCAPQLAAQWHPTKNGPLRPDQISAGSGRRVWWRCEQGHEWRAAVYARTAGKNCPACAGKTVVPGQNDLETCAPQLAAQWHSEKNAPLRPDQVSESPNRRVWWHCERGHEWQSSVASRAVKLSGCPYCSGHKVLSGFNDLQTVAPLVAAQWHPTKNGSLTPTMLTSGSSRKVWWRCSDGHEWKAVVYSRTGARQSGCPVCAGRPVRHVK